MSFIKGPGRGTISFETLSVCFLGSCESIHVKSEVVCWFRYREAAFC